ncbi:MAG TPA: glycosyltransferase family 39 protein [Bacteroidales bacterium]|nr:glycosyltransferase family 39 protein [Bacteroidales bacterium]
MNNLFYSIPIIIVCAAGYYFSWRHYAKGSYTIAILFLMVCGLALRVYTSADFFLHPWDERYHALVAKNLIQHPFLPTLYDNPVLPYDYKNWTANYIWVHKQPLPLWTMASSMCLFGVNEMAVRLPSIILTTIGIWLSFFIGSYFFNKKAGYLTAFLFSINGLIIELSAGRVATDHIDIFFLFFIELAIVFSIMFAQRQKTVFNVLAGVCIGAAILSKWLPAFIVVPIWLLIVLDSGKFKPRMIFFQLIILMTTCLFVFLPWQIYIFNAFPAEAGWESSFNFKHITEVLDERAGPWYYFLDKIRINYGELIYLPLIWFLWKSFKNVRDKKRLAISIWVCIPLLFFSFVKTKMQSYLLFISPALFLMTSEFFLMLNDYKKDRKLKWLFNLILLLLIVLPIRYSIERIKPFEQGNRTPEWTNDLRSLNDRNISNGVLFNYDKPIEAMFYTNLTAYPIIPDRKTITDLLTSGYTVIINDDGNLPDEIKTMKGISLERINKR